MDEIEIIPPGRPFSRTVRIPGSKSITNRVLLLAAMAGGHSVIDSVLLSDDTCQMAAALGGLGFRLELDAARRRISVTGLGGVIPAPGAELFVGGAGTAMRFLTGFVTLGRGRFRIDGNRRMRQRPIGPLLEALARLGANVLSERGDGCPPVVVDTSEREFEGGETWVDGRLSSQFVSATLLPAPLWKRGLRLSLRGETARPFIDMTLKLMGLWGASTTVVDADTIVVPGAQRYSARHFTVEPDASSASYFAAAAALTGGTVRIPGLGRHSVQGDTRFMEVLEKMGARVNWLPAALEVSGTGRLRGIDIAMNTMPDMVPTLAAIAPFASSPTRICKVGFIRHHESDRISALVTELRRLGASVRALTDGLEIQPSKLRPATVETYDDHRIAMSLAIAGLRLGGIKIRNPSCVSKTFPAFFEELRCLCGSDSA